MPGTEPADLSAGVPGTGPVALPADPLADRQATLVSALLHRLDEAHQARARRGYDDGERRAWSYLPGERAGLALHLLGRDQSQEVLRLLGATLRPHVFAQVATVMALEDVLDLREGGAGRRHRGDYYLAVFGTPADERWGWRFEGHHVSVNVSVVHGAVRAVPLFLGANPAVVEHAGGTVSRPLGAEEDCARALLAALDPPDRERAVVSGEAPPDIRTGRRPHVPDPAPEGVPARDLSGPALDRLRRLVEVYLDRLPQPLADRQRAALAGGGWDEVHFSWRGAVEPGRPHYYQLTGPRLLVEYDNTQDGANHVHSVLRDPRGDFAEDLLAEHYRHAH